MKLTYLGFWVSLSGSITPGIITLGILQVGLTRGIFSALLFSLGTILVEVALVCLSLAAISWFFRQKKWLVILNWLTLVMLIAMTFWTGSNLFGPHLGDTNGTIFPSTVSSFSAGIFMRLLTPTFIPFWLGWNAVFFSQGLLTAKYQQAKFYVTGIAIGTLAAHLVFITLSGISHEFLGNMSGVFNWIIFFTLLITLVIHVLRLLGMPMNLARTMRLDQ